MSNTKHPEDDIKPLDTIEELLNSQSPLGHPSCPSELWWDLALQHPLEAQSSLLFQVFTLENPERWGLLEQDNVTRWIEAAAKRLPQGPLFLFAADCAEHVLPIFGRACPNDDRPRQAILVHRLFARGQTTGAISYAARNAAREAGEDSSSAPVEAAAYSAAWVVQAPRYGVAWAVQAAVSAAEGASFEAKVAEQRWQWARLKSYLPKTSITSA